MRGLTDDKIKHTRVGVFDIDGVLRSKLISDHKLQSAIESGFGFCNVIFAWDMADSCYDSIRDYGYPDENVRLDLSTKRSIPWQSKRDFILGDFSQNTSGLSQACPRSLLKRVLKRYEEQGYEVRVGMDIEWFNFKEDSHSLHQKGFANPTPITRGMFGYSTQRMNIYHDYVTQLLQDLEQFRIPLEGLHTETGGGVYEAALSHDKALDFADKAALFKASVKEIASLHGITASFMAKWTSELPGCSGHLHISLWKDGKNLMAGKGGNLSPLAHHFLAGQLFCLPELMPLYGPTVNSYKRYVPGSWAAISVSWGAENRTTAIRTITSPNHHKDTRIEMRVPGADANPYLSIAATLASGLYGIEEKLSLNIKATQGDEYNKTTNTLLPNNLGDAIAQMEKSEIPQRLFGQSFINHFLMTRKWEWQQYNRAVTDWERRRYFEII